MDRATQPWKTEKSQAELEKFTCLPSPERTQVRTAVHSFEPRIVFHIQQTLSNGETNTFRMQTIWLF